MHLARCRLALADRLAQAPPHRSVARQLAAGEAAQRFGVPQTRPGRKHRASHRSVMSEPVRFAQGELKLRPAKYPKLRRVRCTIQLSKSNSFRPSSRGGWLHSAIVVTVADCQAGYNWLFAWTSARSSSPLLWGWGHLPASVAFRPTVCGSAWRDDKHSCEDSAMKLPLSWPWQAFGWIVVLRRHHWRFAPKVSRTACSSS